MNYEGTFRIGLSKLLLQGGQEWNCCPVPPVPISWTFYKHSVSTIHVSKIIPKFTIQGKKNPETIKISFLRCMVACVGTGCISSNLKDQTLIF